MLLFWECAKLRVLDQIRPFKNISFYSLMWYFITQDWFQGNLNAKKVVKGQFSKVQPVWKSIWKSSEWDIKLCMTCCTIYQLLMHFCYIILSPHLHRDVMLHTLVHVRMYSAKQLTWPGLGCTVQWQDGVTTEACSLPVIKDQWHLNLKASILIIFSSHHVFNAWSGTSQDLQSVVTKYLDKCIIERWYPGLGLFKILLQFQY